jgi:glycosyltransferase involved in cell wall biosynthesis
LKILSLFLRYGDSDYKGAYQNLMDFYAHLPGLSVESVLIDTALPDGVKAWIGSCARLLAGDNQRGEFSGWDTAITTYRKRLSDFDLVHLVTSAFKNEYNGFYKLVCKEMFGYVHATPGVLLAHVDAYPEPVRLFGRCFQTWACSKFLLARPADILALGGLTGPFSGADFFAEGSEPFRHKAPLSTNYKHFLLDWLTGDGLPDGKWHSVFRYSAQDIAKFRFKALRILDEHSLSMRIRESGVRIVDYTWWHANQHQVWDTALPDELLQVQERNRYLFGYPIVKGSSMREASRSNNPKAEDLVRCRSETELFSGSLIDALLAGSNKKIREGKILSLLDKISILMGAGYQFGYKQVEWLKDESEELTQDGPFPITRGLHAQWLAFDNLREAFDINTTSGRRSFCEWASDWGNNDLIIPLTQGGTYKDCNILDTIQRPTFFEGGVNVIGYAKGELGIGEDVRMAIRALSTTEYKVCVPNLPLKIPSRQDDNSVLGYLVPKPIYNINLICMPNYETLRLFGSTGRNIFEGRYNIGFWQWELSRFPQQMKCSLNLVDEIWSASRFTAEAMRSASSQPVFHMPIVVELPEKLSAWKRSDFSLKEEDFIFLTVFDGNSGLRRKNPLGTVSAFAAAFESVKNVRLVVKAMNVKNEDPDWQAIEELARRDSRINLLVEVISRDKLLGLQSVCDCFVSLHRAEGFGRNISEAMILGKPVIVSDYSGNKDFTTEDTAFLVSGNEQPLRAGDYTLEVGQRWFEPSHEAAVEALRQSLTQPNIRAKKAHAGKQMIETKYSAEAVGSAYMKRFSDLGMS